MKRHLLRLLIVSALNITFLLIVGNAYGQGRKSIPNGEHFPNPGGTSVTESVFGSIDLTGPFFQSLGTNGRTCATCHQPSDGMSVSADHIQDRFNTSNGLDPIFRPVDGANCNHGLDFSTVAARSNSYGLLRTRGLIRVGITIPATADFVVTSANNPYGCTETSTVSMYRRPLPSTNLRFLSAVMWDGRESSPLTGTTKITYATYPTALVTDLLHQSLDATNGHAQGLGNRPTPAEQLEIVAFELGLVTAQMTANGGGKLDAQGAKGGPLALFTQPFFISINSSVQFLLASLGLTGPETPGGQSSPGDGHFTSAVFNLYDAWSSLPYPDPRAAILRGEKIFNSKTFTISGVAGINDDLSAGGLVAGGVPALHNGTCGTCHDTPNVGNHSFPTPLNIGVGDFISPGASTSMGGLDLSYLPKITVCKKDPMTGLATSACTTTTDLGQAAIDGQYAHVGKLKGPVLRGLASRAPFFHNGSAETLVDVVRFYEVRFGLTLTAGEEADLVAFLNAL